MPSDAFCLAPNDVAPETVDVSQRGGVRGRNILDNVVEVETWGLIQHMCGRDKAGVLFADFKAAFPSILAEWIFAVLVAMGIPSETV
eukprot:9423224-Pyramimonas_sp.AAC.1